MPFLIGAVPLLLLRWRLNTLAFGDAEAEALGVNVRALRAVLIFCSTLLTASVVSIAGVIGWVGLIIPHIVRFISGPDNRSVMPLSLVFGAGFLVIVDTCCRTIMASEIPLGILTSIIGAPFFFYILLRTSKAGGRAMILRDEGLDCGYVGRTVLKDVNASFGTGEVVCLLGPNGVGKTTLFKTMLGFLRPQAGRVTLDGQDVARMGRREFARHVAYVPQLHEPPFPYSVLDVVLAGRAARLGPFSQPAREDYAKAEEVLEALSVSKLRDKTFTECSGGEQQMVLVARSLVQEPEMVVMDEPTASLDFGNQVRMLGCVRNLCRDRGLGVIMTTHNPDHAYLCASRALLITQDHEILDGPVDEVVTEANMRRAYGIEVKVTEAVSDEGERIKTCVPILP